MSTFDTTCNKIKARMGLSNITESKDKIADKINQLVKAIASAVKDENYETIQEQATKLISACEALIQAKDVLGGDDDLDIGGDDDLDLDLDTGEDLDTDDDLDLDMDTESEDEDDDLDLDLDAEEDEDDK